LDCVGVWPVAAEVNEHVVEYGRMFNELDDEMVVAVCVIGTGTATNSGVPRKSGQRINPVGETHSQRSSFQSDWHVPAVRKRARTEKSACSSKPRAHSKRPVTRNRGWGGRSRGGGAFAFKKSHGLPSAEHRLDEVPPRCDLRGEFNSGGAAPPAGAPVTHASPVWNIKIATVDLLPEALQQIRQCFS